MLDGAEMLLTKGAKRLELPVSIMRKPRSVGIIPQVPTIYEVSARLGGRRPQNEHASTTLGNTSLQVLAPHSVSTRLHTRIHTHAHTQTHVRARLHTHLARLVGIIPQVPTKYEVSARTPEVPIIFEVSLRTPLR